MKGRCLPGQGGVCSYCILLLYGDQFWLCVLPWGHVAYAYSRTLPILWPPFPALNPVSSNPHIDPVPQLAHQVPFICPFNGLHHPQVVPLASLIVTEADVQMRTLALRCMCFALGISVAPALLFYTLAHLVWQIIHFTCFSPATCSDSFSNLEDFTLTFSLISAPCVYQRLKSSFEHVMEHLRALWDKIFASLRQKREKLNGFPFLP